MLLGGVTSGPDGNLWIPGWIPSGGGSQGLVFRVTIGGTATAKQTPTATSQPFGITSGSDGNVWTIGNTSIVARINPSTFAITETQLQNANVINPNMTFGPDGALWFTEQVDNAIGRMTTAGTYAKFSVTGSPTDICVGQDGNLWFIASDAPNNANYLGRLTTAGGLTEYSIPQEAGSSITSGSDGNVWFTYRFTPTIARFLIP